MGGATRTTPYLVPNVSNVVQITANHKADLAVLCSDGNIYVHRKNGGVFSKATFVNNVGDIVVYDFKNISTKA